MRTDTTPSFITELPLKTTSANESTTLVRLDTGRQLYNACLGESLNRLALIRQSKEFQEIQKLPKTIDGEQNKERTEAFKQLNKKHGFTDYDLQHYAGLIFRDNTLYWSGLEIPCIVDMDNDLISYGLKHRVKYCRIVRRKINARNRFYLQLILEGTPFQNPESKIGSEEIGLDAGVSASNPGNYNENGTVKKGSKNWIKSNRYKSLSNELSETDRILAAYRKSLHGKDINEILATGTRIKTEKVAYKG